MRTLLILALAVAPAFSQDTVQEKQIERKIENVRMTVDFTDTPLSEVVTYIREVADINILLDGRVDGINDITVKIRVQELKVKSILKLMLTGTDLGYTYQDNVLLITDKEQINKKLALELYDIRDILYPLKDFPGVDIQLGDSGLGATFGVDDGNESDPMPVEEMIQTHTGQGFWDEVEGASVVLNNGILVVKATKDVHRQVRRMLNILRRNK